MKKVSFFVKNQRVAGILHLPLTKKSSGIVMIHGFKGDKDEHGRFVEAARRFCEEGFYVLRFDCRGTGESDGKFEDMTIDSEVEDLMNAINFLRKQNVNKIGVLGLSLGGEIAILTATKSDIEALVLWAPVTSSSIWKRGFSEKQVQELRSKGTTIVYSRKTGKPWVIGYGFFESAIHTKVEDALTKIKCPTLIIHGDKDTTVPLECSQLAIKKIKAVKELRVITGANHGFYEHLNEIINLSVEWFKKYL